MVAIGGIDATNARAIVAAGFDGVSVIRAVLSQPDPEQAARTLRTAVRAGLGARS
jgi:thiamine monophosphate synthase